MDVFIFKRKKVRPMKKLFLILMLLPVFSMVSGCASFSQSDSAEVVVQYATIKFINKDADPITRAHKVIDIATEARTYFDSETLPIAQVESLIREKIDWAKLDLADKILVDALIDKVMDEVEGAGSIPEDKRVSGSKVLGWIIDGARLAGG